MADVLSQSEIDALLKSMKESSSDASAASSPSNQTSQASDSGFDSDEEYSKYDFYSPRKFTKERLKLLRSIFENYARILTSQVNGIYRTMTDITVIELRESRYYEYVNSFHENDCMTIIEVSVKKKGKFTVPMMSYVTPGLILTLANRMLGGGAEVISVEEDYRYSDIEMSLYKRIMESFIHTLADGFTNYIDVDFQPSRVEENPSMVQEVGQDETVVLVVMNVDVTGIASEKIRFCIPGTLLEQIFRTIDSRKMLARGFKYSNNSDTIMHHLENTRFPLTAQLGTVRLPIEDLCSLKEGDIIDLNKTKDSLLTLYVGRQSWFKCSMGTHKRNVAVRIEERIDRESDDEDEKTPSIELTEPEAEPAEEAVDDQSNSN
ncbi:MAG: FliM/FliN family flagellar motor switch protein [Lachnospiraceae bacterium]|nr:FliM/FliN family flagellar motor switch protein [Lachnospiraceae bacterium]